MIPVLESDCEDGPHNDVRWFRLGSAYRIQGNKAKAIAAYERMLELDPFAPNVRKVVELGITPRVNTGIAHKEPGVGQVGAGLVRPPMAIFEEALVAFADQHGFS